MTSSNVLLFSGIVFDVVSHHQILRSLLLKKGKLHRGGEESAPLLYQILKSPACLGLKPGLHIIVMVAAHACDNAPKRIFKPSTQRDQYLRSLLPHGDQTIAGQLEKHVLEHMLEILQLIWRPGLTQSDYLFQA